MVSALTHTDALRMLVEYSAPLEQIKTELGKHSFDADQCLFVITPAHMRDILERFLGGALTVEQIEAWANLIEMRDGLEFADGEAGPSRECLHELANPLLTEPLSKESALRMRDELATQTI
jgi:hypothetical protein